MSTTTPYEVQQRQWIIDAARRQALSDLEDQMIAQAEQMDAEHPTEKLRVITHREEAIRQDGYDEGVQDGYDEGVEDGKDAAVEDADGTLYHLIHAAIHRIEYLGLDADLSALDVLKRMRSEVGE